MHRDDDDDFYPAYKLIYDEKVLWRDGNSSGLQETRKEDNPAFFTDFKSERLKSLLYVLVVRNCWENTNKYFPEKSLRYEHSSIELQQSYNVSKVIDDNSLIIHIHKTNYMSCISHRHPQWFSEKFHGRNWPSTGSFR